MILPPTVTSHLATGNGQSQTSSIGPSHQPLQQRMAEKHRKPRFRAKHTISDITLVKEQTDAVTRLKGFHKQKQFGSGQIQKPKHQSYKNASGGILSASKDSVTGRIGSALFYNSDYFSSDSDMLPFA